MPIQYRVLTANCANDTIGAGAVDRIVAQFNEDRADFYIINCQEVSFSKTLKQLRDKAGALLITCCGYMPTHTKLATQFHADTGIGTFILHKKDTQVSIESTAVVRRKPTRLAGGSGYNKGGIISTFSIVKAEERPIKIEAISAHLDSNSAEKRTIDWHNIHAKRRKDTFSSVELLQVAYLSRPMIIAVGIDANTRNFLMNSHTAQNPWERPTDHPELAALHQASIGSARFSNESTYREYNRPQSVVTTTADKKRKGYTLGGSLDHVFISGGTNNETSQSLVIDPAKDSDRDHSIIISPLQALEVPNSPTKLSAIKKIMANDLRHASPSLARQLEDLSVDIDSQTLLLIHNRLLSKEGLLQKMIGLHARKLALNQRLKHMTPSPEVSTLSALLFPTTAWLENISLDSLDESLSSYESQVALMSSLLTIIEKYPLNETLISAFITVLHQYEPTECSADAPKPSVSYESMMLALDTALREQYDEQNRLIKAAHLKESTCHVITETQTLINIDKNLSIYDLSLLVAVLKQCKQIQDALARVQDSSINEEEKINQANALHSAINNLKLLSHEVSSRSSPGWKKLGYACMALGLSAALLGIILSVPTFGISLIIPIALAVSGVVSALAGDILYLASKEHGLAKAISDDTQTLERNLQQI